MGVLGERGVRVLSHRGYWKAPAERNSIEAFDRSFALGFGTELDIRDLDGMLTVSHDPPRAGALAAHAVFEIMAGHDPGLTLAVNIKADGLQASLVDMLMQAGLLDVFVFDMSVPDTLHWLNTGIPVFVRHSDIEPEPVLYPEASGIWLDAFKSEWWGEETLVRHFNAGKRVCIVSPELHRRDHRPLWERLLGMDVLSSEALMICTDFPEEAARVFRHGD